MELHHARIRGPLPKEACADLGVRNAARSHDTRPKRARIALLCCAVPIVKRCRWRQQLDRERLLSLTAALPA
eukprot:90994-Prymnesium_polylepis.1